MSTINNLVFKGGGVLGIAYAGAIKVLQDNGILAGIQKVAGTSAGAITAALVSLNYDSDTITKVVQSTDFKSFEDREDPLRIPLTYGFYAGDALFSFIQGLIANKGLDAAATFRDFNSNGCKDLHVFSTDLNIGSIQEFSFAATPDAIVAEAVRASMSIPLFFKAWKFSNSIPNDHIYVDGGVMYNYPLTAFDSDGTENPCTLGFYLSDLKNASGDNGLKFENIIGYVKALFETVLGSQEIDFERDPEMEKRTVKIDDLGLSATDFKLTTDQQNALFDSGVTYTTQFFANNPQLLAQSS